MPLPIDLSAYLPNGVQALHLGLALLTVIAFAAVGAVACGRQRDPTMDIFAGAGLVTGLMTLAGVGLQTPFSWMAYLLWAVAPVAVVIAWRRNRGTGTSPPHVALLVRILILALPLVLAVGAMRASQWDEFSQWLPNTFYIFHHDAFPHQDLPVSSSVFPAYPYGGPLIGLLVSTAASALADTKVFVENAIAVGNTLLLLAFAPVYLSMIRRGLGDDSIRLHGWTAAALGILGVTFLSTVFVQKLVFTAYADASTGVLMAVLSILIWRLLESLRLQDGEDQTLAWQFAFACMLFVNLKQTNLVLLALLLGAAFLIALRDPDLRVTAFISRLPILLIAPGAIYLAWRFHVDAHLGAGEFSIRPQDQWLTDEALAILGRMLEIASNKGAYFGMMAVLSAIGIWSFLTGRGGSFGRLCILVGGVFLGYFLFLWVMYVTAFTPFEGRNAASFWRYNTQLGLLGAAAAAMGGAMVWSRRIAPKLAERRGLRQGLSLGLVLMVFAAPIGLNHKIRFDIRPQKDHMRAVGQDLADRLPSGAKIGLIDPKGQGFAAQVIRYEITSRSTDPKPPALIYQARGSFRDYDQLMSRFDAQETTYLWVHQTEPAFNDWLGRTLEPAASHLMEKHGDGWALVHSWPYDGYTDPYSLPD